MTLGTARSATPAGRRPPAPSAWTTPSPQRRAGSWQGAGSASGHPRCTADPGPRRRAARAPAPRATAAACRPAPGLQPGHPVLPRAGAAATRTRARPRSANEGSTRAPGPAGPGAADRPHVRARSGDRPAGQVAGEGRSGRRRPARVEGAPARRTRPRPRGGARRSQGAARRVPAGPTPGRNGACNRDDPGGQAGDVFRPPTAVPKADGARTGRRGRRGRPGPRADAPARMCEDPGGGPKGRRQSRRARAQAQDAGRADRVPAAPADPALGGAAKAAVGGCTWGASSRRGAPGSTGRSRLGQGSRGC